jgi:hypothetical protein
MGQEGGEVNASTPAVEEAQANVGAVVMGRNMFGGGPGLWREEPTWNGWWGDDPPFHAPVFVLTHYPREPLEMRGGTTFTFVTDGIESALEEARAAAGDMDVLLGGGPKRRTGTLRPGCSTSSSCTSRWCCSATGSGCSSTSGRSSSGGSA